MPRLGRLAVVGEVATQGEHVRVLRDALEQGLQHAGGRAAEVQVAHGGDSETAAFG